MIEAVATCYDRLIEDNLEGGIIWVGGKKFCVSVCIGCECVSWAEGAGGSDKLEWDGVLTLLRIEIKEKFNQFGGVRTDEERSGRISPLDLLKMIDG